MHTQLSEQQLVQIASMDRASIIQDILGGKWGFEVDYSPQYLQQLSLDRLRHTYLALRTQCRQDRR